MNRRSFSRGAVTSAVASLAMPGLTLASSSKKVGGLMDAPDRCVGERFVTADGAQMTLESAERVGRDVRLAQWRLHFRTDSGQVADGIHALRAASGATVPLFLTTNGALALACIARAA